MNIFYLHKEPEVSARLHCDKHVVKMIIEYAQMLSTAHRMIDGEQYYDLSKNSRRIARWRHPNSNLENVLYKASHQNHPSAVWVRENAIQYQYMYDLFVALCDEYTYRYGKVHMTDSKLRDVLNNIPDKMPLGDWREPPQQCQMMSSQKAVSMRIINTIENTKSHSQNGLTEKSHNLCYESIS